MTAIIDGRLRAKINKVGECAQVEAIIVVQESEDLHADGGGLARQVVEAAIGCTGEVPNAVRYFPRANAAVIMASGRFLKQVLEDERLHAASATDTEVIGFPDM